MLVGIGHIAGLGLGQLSTLLQAIITQENANPALNNPGNLMYAGQPGATGTPGTIASFDTYADGLQALVNQLNLYANGTCQMCAGQPQTIAGTFAIYAPAGDGNNNPVAYANNVATALGVPTTTPLSAVLAGSASTTNTGASASSGDDSDDDDSDDMTPVYVALGAVAIFGVWATMRAA